jgi:hypothetical protein
MLRNINPQNIPKAVRNHETIQKDLLYTLCALFNDEELERLIQQKQALLEAKKLQRDFELSEMERTNSYIERGCYE